jgi:hypothetical protein
MLHKRTFVIAGAILALCASLEAATSVGYFTDGLDANGLSQVSDTGLAVPITANGFTAVQITNIAAFVGAGNLSTITILVIDEINNGSPTAALLSVSTALSNWVAGGGVIAIHDRNVCRGTCTPVPGSAGVSFHFLQGTDNGNDINVETAGTLVTNGPFGVINNTTLDNGNPPSGFSDNGYVVLGTLPAGGVGILNNGTAGHEVAVSYPFGAGWVYYSTIPLDLFVNIENITVFNPLPLAFRTIYAPNMVAYLECLASRACSTGAATGTATAAPTLSEWGLGILAILLMGCAGVMLRSGPGERTTR